MSDSQGGPGIDPARAVDLLRALREEAANPRTLYHQGEAARTSWHQRVLSVLAGALGRDSELAVQMAKNRYGLIMFTDGTPDRAWEDAFVSGVQTAIGYIDAAIFELEIAKESQVRREAQPQAKGHSESGDPDKRAVFVVHGRNIAARDAMFAFLRSLELIPIEWSQAVAATGRPSPYVGEVLSAAFGRAQAVLVLLTPDDEARLRSPFRDEHEPSHETNLTPQARANVNRPGFDGDWYAPPFVESDNWNHAAVHRRRQQWEDGDTHQSSGDESLICSIRGARSSISPAIWASAIRRSTSGGVRRPSTEGSSPV